MKIFKSIDLPNKEYSSKNDLFSALKNSAKEIIGLKRATIKESLPVDMTHFIKSTEASKGMDLEDGFIYPVINTTKYIDSHNDVHLNGIWNKSINEQQGKIYYIVDHSLEVGKVAAFPKDVEMFAKEISWKALGLDAEGTTQALVYKIAKKNIKLDYVLDIIEDKTDIQHSVRMQYVKMSLAINDRGEEIKEELKTWNKHIDSIANKEVAKEGGYFWAIEEAKIFKEGSMVLAGSNDITPLMQPKDIEPSSDTHKTEPPKGTHETTQSSLIKIMMC